MTEGTQETVATETQDPGVAQYIGADGALKDGWKENLLPEEVRSEGTWDRFGKIQDVFKSESEARKLVSKKGIIPLTDKSTPEDIAVYHKATGVPDKPEGYALKRPDDFPEQYWDDNFARSAEQVFHKIHLPAAAAKALVDFNNQAVLDNIKKMGESEKEADRKIYAQTGANYEQNKTDANDMFEKNTANLSEELRTGMLAEINKPERRPLFYAFLGQVARSFDEHTIMQGGKLTGTKGIDQRRQEILNDPAYVDKDNQDPAKHQKLIEELRVLGERKTAMQMNK